MQFWVNQAFNGISYAALLFLVGGGLTLIFGVMKIVNIAHGSFYLLGGYVGVAVVARTGSFYLALGAAAVTVALVGMLIERVFLRVVEGDDLRQMLLTMGIALFVQDLCLLVWGGDPFNLRGPAYFERSVRLGAFSFPILRLFMIGAAAVFFVVTIAALVCVARAAWGRQQAAVLQQLGQDHVVVNHQRADTLPGQIFDITFGVKCFTHGCPPNFPEPERLHFGR